MFPRLIYHTLSSSELFRLRKAFKMKFKQQALEGDPRKARMNLDDPNPDNLPGPLRVCALALNQIKGFKEHLPLVSVLCNKGLRARHWENLNKAAGFDITPNAGTSLRKVVQMDLGGLLKEFEVVSSGASREYNLELSLANMKGAWESARLSFAQNPDVGVQVLDGLEEVRELAEEHLITTHTIKNSPFVGPFVGSTVLEVEHSHILVFSYQQNFVPYDVKVWEATLRMVHEALTVWMKVQTMWVELTPIFSTPDIPHQLPDENQLFKEVDQKWVSVMDKTVSSERLLDVVADEKTLKEVTSCLQNFAVIQKAVHTYLDSKRRVFPRLYFLSNEELTALLCETEAARLQDHIRKCFDGVHALLLDEQDAIYAVSSKEGETISLLKKLPASQARQSIEHWLLQFQEAMTNTLKMKTCEGVEKWTRRGGGGGGRDLESIVPPWPLQVTLTVRHVFWTAEVHQAICGGTQALQECLTRVEGEVHLIVAALRKTHLDSGRQSSRTPATSPPSSAASDSTPRTPPSSGRVGAGSRLAPSPSRHALSVLILSAVYARDVLKELIDRGVTDEEAFCWLAQLRYYMKEDEMEARMLHCSLPWGWEYVGAEGRLVVTPLTARAYHTLVTAYHAHLGGAPEGPAGTGKTETVKDLARSLAVNCLVFNCSDDLDFISMGKFFTGVAASGSWACFDEFNRLEVGVLSVAAQQILTVVRARREGRGTFSMEGGLPLGLSAQGFLAVTMNPKYRGRVALPDNLKLLLRPVSMMTADYQSIAEVSLLSCGFAHARALAARVVGVMAHCQTMLHPHHHYDFGTSLPEWSETEVVLRALREVNQPKLVADDYERFESILSDFFLELPPTPRPPADNLVSFLEKVCEERGLLATNEFLLKTLQLYETLRERHGVMVVGPPCGSKTTIIQTLSAALGMMEGDQPIHVEVLNPKTLTQAQLIGSLDPVNREWSDGLVAQVIRHANARRTWLLFDGPTDASWVENLNTALDDSQKLCLPSGETVPVPEDMATIFEVLDLSQASPATVSRCGMVYVGGQTIGWAAILHSWLHHHAHGPWWGEYGALLRELANWLIPPVLEFVKAHCRYLLPVVEVSLVRSIFPLTETVVNEVLQDGSISQKDRPKVGPIWTTASFLFSVTWCIAGALTLPAKETFNVFFRRLVMGYIRQHPTPSMIEQIGCPYPGDGSVFDVLFDAKQRSFWRPWTDVIKHTEIQETTKISSLLVPTVESARLSYLVDVCGRATNGILLVGEGQSGRKVVVRHHLKNLATDASEYAILPVTPAATALSVKLPGAAGDGRLGCQRGSSAGRVHRRPPPGLPRRLPGTTRPRAGAGGHAEEELVRRGFDDQRALEDITWIGGASLHAGRASGGGGDSGGGGEERAPDLLHPRCQAGFMAIAAHALSKDTITRVFTTQLNVFLRAGGFVPDVFTVIPGVISGTMGVLDHVQTALRPTPAKSHYTFSLATAARVVNSISFLKKESMETKRHFVRVWVHEVYREVCDRLTETAEVTAVYQLLIRTIKTSFRDKIHVIFDKICNEDGSVTEACLERVCWGVMGSLDTPAAERRYEELIDAAQLRQTIAAFIEEYNGQHQTKLNLVTFNFKYEDLGWVIRLFRCGLGRYVVQHVSRICRILGRAGGHMMLVGVGGSGRRSLTHLAAHICGHRLVHPRIVARDGYSDLRRVLKDALITAGVEEKATVVLVGDEVLQHPTILHLLNTLILTGDVPNLLSPEDHSYLLERLRLYAEDRGVTETDLWHEQAQRVADLVHVVITAPPTPELRHIFASYPALTTHITVDYFKPWPREALVKVGEHYLEAVPLRRSIKDAVISAATATHQTARFEEADSAPDGAEGEGERVSEDILTEGKWCPQVTPASYLHLLQEFRALFTARQTQVTAVKKKYLSGLDKLAFAASQISVMQEMLASLGPQIEEATQDVSKMMEIIEQESLEVEERRKLVSAEEEEAGVHAANARALQEECQAELNQAMPALHEAVESLNTLKPADITVVKSMKNPPQAIKLVMAAVCVMLEIKPEKMKNSSGKTIFEYWGPSKRLLGDMSFLQQLKDYDKDNIPEAVMDKINKEYVRLPEFDPVSVAKASSAAEGLCKWVRAMASYNAIAKSSHSPMFFLHMIHV
ncbi:dynein axonemal heavy chain 7-like [Penaeus chinensis]|uniref:dynein axonemal heavy chain 7-like n=1 Tax=Penaeus chinensis TaxID=139456 RepID=UPI001FB710AE|nr:dynein axonemal heavy chain 7-like [Penaeus chinensis]